MSQEFDHCSNGNKQLVVATGKLRWRICHEYDDNEEVTMMTKEKLMTSDDHDTHEHDHQNMMVIWNLCTNNLWYVVCDISFTPVPIHHKQSRAAET